MNMLEKVEVVHFVGHSLPIADGYALRTNYLVQNQRRLGVESAVVTRPDYDERYSEKLKSEDTVECIKHFHRLIL